MICQTTTFECCRCGRVHNGSGLPAGWTANRREGAFCDDCEGQMRIPSRKRAMPRKTAHAA